VQPSAEANGGGWKATRTENGFISSSHEENTVRSSSSESDVTGGYPRDNKVSLQQPAETSKQIDFFKREADEYGSSQSPLLTLCHIDLLDCAVETDSCTKVSADHPESTTLSDGTNGRAFASPRNDSLPNDETETANRELLTSVNVTCGGQSIRDVAMSSHSFENNRAVDCSKSRATGANERHFSPVPGLFRDAERDNRPIVDVQEDCKEDSGRGMLSRSTDVIKKTDVGESHQQYIISPQSVTASCRSSASPTVVSSQSSTGQCQVRLPVTVAIQRTEAKENRASSIEEATCTRADKAAGERTVDNGTPETEGAAVDDSRSDCHVTKLAGQLQRLSRHTINNKLKGLRVTPVESSPMTSSSSSLPSSSATMSPTGSSSHPAAVASCSSYSSDRCPSSKPQVELPLIVSVIGGASLRLPNTAAVRLSTALLPKPFLLRQSSSPFSPSSSSYRPIVRPVTSSSSPQSVTQSRDRSSSCVNGVANICPPEVAGSPPQESNLEYRADTPKDGAGVSCDFPSAVRVDATVNEPHRQCDKQDVGNRSTGISGWQNMNANDDFQSSSLFPCNSGCTPSTKSASNLAEVQSANPEMSSKSRISSTVKRCWQSSLPVWTPRPFQSVISPTVTSPSNSSPIRPAKLVGAVTETDFSQVSSEKRPVDVSATTFRPSARNAPPATVTPATELFFDAVTTLSPVTPSSVQRSPVQPAVLGSRCHDQQQLSPTATADRDRGSKAVSPVVWVESCEQNSSSTSPPAVGLSALRALSAVLREQDNDEMTIISTVHRTRGNPTTTNRQGPSSAPAMAATATVAKVAAVRDLMPEVTLKTGRSIGRPLIDAVKPESNHTTSASELSVHTSKDAACKVTSTANEVKLKPAKEVNADKCVDLADCFGLNKPEDNPRELISATEETGVKLQVSMLKGAFGVGFCIEGGTDSPTGSSPVKVKRIFKGL
jgi:hypothetical protein